MVFDQAETDFRGEDLNTTLFEEAVWRDSLRIPDMLETANSAAVMAKLPPVYFCTSHLCRSLMMYPMSPSELPTSLWRIQGGNRC